MKKIERFEDLNIWVSAKSLVVQIYSRFGNIKDYGFRDQIQRASISVMNNIAEGFERNSNKDFIRFLVIAKSSCGEVRSMLYAAQALKFIDLEISNNLIEYCVKLSSSIASLIKHLKCFNT